MPVVPFSAAPAPNGTPQVPMQAPDPTFTLMAAAVMHSEGRLIKKDNGDGEFAILNKDLVNGHHR